MTTSDPYSEAAIMVNDALGLERAFHNAGLPEELHDLITTDPDFTKLLVLQIAKMADLTGSTSIQDLGLSTRVTNALLRYGLSMVYELCLMTPAQVQQVWSIGANAVEEIEEALAKYGLGLK